MNPKKACLLAACFVPLAACASSAPTTSSALPADDGGMPPPRPDAGSDAPGISGCEPGHADCNGDPTDGCETDLSQPQHCGSCHTACAAPTPVCVMGGGPGYACAASCATYQALCGSSCVDPATDVANCGGCGKACDAPAHAIATCSSAHCAFSCELGHHLCGTQSCADDTSVASCGSSCVPCPMPPHAQSTCTAGACGFTCDSGWADCDGNAANGCEASLLQDGGDCGGCGHSCLGGACVNGACTPAQVAQVASPDQIAGDVDNLYVRSGGNTLVQLTKAGAVLSSNGFTYTSLVGQDAKHVYLRTPGGPSAIESVWKGASLATYLYGGNITFSAVSGSVLAWSNDQTNVLTGPTTGGQSSIKYSTSGLLVAMAGDLGGIITLEQFGADEYMYEHDQSFSTVKQLSVPNPHTPFFLVLDATNVYWPEIAPNAIWKSPRNGAAAVQLATCKTMPTAVAVDATNVYWSEIAAATIYSVPIAGGPVTTIASASADGLYVDDKGIYWADSSGGRIMLLAK